MATLPGLLFSFSMLDVAPLFHLMSLHNYPCLDMFTTYLCLLRFLLSLNSLANLPHLIALATYPYLPGLLFSLVVLILSLVILTILHVLIGKFTK
jgi:hypothetical protein